jgi:hypothetical protein
MKIHVDGFLLQLAILICTKKWIKKESGLNFYHNKKWNRKTIFLTTDGKVGFDNEIALPLWDNLEQLTLPKKQLEFINKFDKIVIGISSPKQDLLGIHLSQENMESEIYCLGAAIYSSRLINSETVFVTLITMFLNNPRRVLTKLLQSLVAFVRTVKHMKSEVAAFAQILEHDDLNSIRSNSE